MEENRTDTPMIPKHQAEMHDMHLVHVNSNIKVVAIILAVLLGLSIIATAYSAVSMSRAMIEQSKVFVDNYTTRTDKWLSTLLQMQNGYQPAEVLNEKVSSGDVQQLPVP